MSNPNCNYNLPSGEFYSKNQEAYESELKENDKKHKIYSLGLYISIIIFLISSILFIILFKRNKDIINGTINQSNNENEIQLTSAWSVSVIVCLIISILTIGSGIFSGIFMLKYGKTINKPIITDEMRPCYSQIKKELLQPITSQTQTTSPTLPTSGIKTSITGGQTGQTGGSQNIQSGTSITGTGLDKLKGMDITTQSGELTSTQGGGTQSSINDANTGGSLSFNQNQTNQNTAGVSASVYDTTTTGVSPTQKSGTVSGTATSNSSSSGAITINT